MPDLVGHALGRYHILQQLGEGGMATVYKAYDTHLETEVAVKVIRTENILPKALERSLKRFEREAKSLARLTHPNIVKVMDYGKQDGNPYLVMPFLPGGTLKQKLGKPIPWQDAIQLLLPIAEALDYAHSQHMVHRDVKPSNILLTERGQPMLTDFGIAKILDLEETQDLTGTSATIGTPEYMAPEQATAKTVDHRADIYALGIVLYEMLTGRKPFVADTPMAVLIMQARDPLPSLKKYAPNLPDDVERLLLRALAKLPDYRYQSMGEVVVAFKKLLHEDAARGSPKPAVASRPAQATREPAVVSKPALQVTREPAIAPRPAQATREPAVVSKPQATPGPAVAPKPAQVKSEVVASAEQPPTEPPKKVPAGKKLSRPIMAGLLAGLTLAVIAVVLLLSRQGGGSPVAPTATLTAEPTFTLTPTETLVPTETPTLTPVVVLPSEIVGIWDYKQYRCQTGNPQNSTNQGTFDFREDGTVTLFEKIGTWTLDGNRIEINFGNSFGELYVGHIINGEMSGVITKAPDCWVATKQ